MSPAKTNATGRDGETRSLIAKTCHEAKSCGRSIDGVAVVTNFARMTDEAFRQSVEQDFGLTPSV